MLIGTGAISILNKMKILLIFISVLLSINSYTQANLIIINGTLTTTNINRGDYLKFSFRVKNIGTSSAGISKTRISFSTTTSITGSLFIADISTEFLAANQETQDVNYIIPLPYNVPSGINYVILSVDATNAVLESNEANDFYISTTFNVGVSDSRQQNLPYPIIFVHGLNSNNSTWNDFVSVLRGYYGWSNGGNLKYCLNQDATSTEKNADVHAFTSVSNLLVGDYYTVNFDVDRNGNEQPALTFVYSNQSAIAKQGLALKDAIQKVLQKTGRDKVILVGHSMGGLASREYLQNSSLWQQPTNHHVAKLLTVGTPHGGSNTGVSGWSIIAGVNEYSEAVRDLRSTYSISNAVGVYLFGGLESYSIINNSNFFNYTNVDVNCDGVEGGTIIGLNNKNIPTDLQYSCVIGEILGVGGDLVVPTSSANLNNFRPIVNADTFIVSAGHTYLPSEEQVLMLGMDEPKRKELAFEIFAGRNYFGILSKQSQSTNIYSDSDYYKFTVPANGIVNLEMLGIHVSNCNIKITNSSNNIVLFANTNGKGYISITNTFVTAGTYYLSISALAEEKSWQFSYSIKYTFIQSVPLTLLDFKASIKEGQTFLNWKTENEINTEKFVIERSLNSIDWNVLGTTSAGKNSYDFIDNRPINGINFYRLKMMDKDGSYTYSEIRQVIFIFKNHFVIAPNPAVEYADILFKDFVNFGQVTVFDLMGKKVFNKEIIALKSLRIPTGNLVKGVYMVCVTINGEVQTHKLVISN